MFNIPLRAARTKKRHAQPSSHRPQIERLEDRLVAAVANGTILVPNWHSNFDTNTNNQNKDAITGIIGVVPHSDGVTSDQSQVAVNSQLGPTMPKFVEPEYLAEDPNNDSVLYVTDMAAGVFGTGAILKVVGRNRPSTTPRG